MSKETYSEHDLRITESTEPEEIRAFVEHRMKNPIELEEYDVVVWDFSTHQPDMDALRGVAANMEEGRYHIPFQLAAPWAYMAELIPDEVRNLPVLAYSEKFEMYRTHTNYRAVRDAIDDSVHRAEMQKWLEDYNDG